jgi:hypothetical protein
MKNKTYYNYIYLNPFRKGRYSFNFLNFCLLYEPYYVGKGKNLRYLDHIKECIGNDLRLKKNSLKCKKLFSIFNEIKKDYDLETTLKIMESFVIRIAFTDSEKVAYKNERILIKQIKMLEEGGTLTNRKDNGIKLNISETNMKKLEKMFKG